MISTVSDICHLKEEDISVLCIFKDESSIFLVCLMRVYLLKLTLASQHIDYTLNRLKATKLQEEKAHYGLCKVVECITNRIKISINVKSDIFSSLLWIFPALRNKIKMSNLWRPTQTRQKRLLRISFIKLHPTYATKSMWNVDIWLTKTTANADI